LGTIKAWMNVGYGIDMSKLFCAIAVGGAAVIQVCLMSNVSLAQSDKASVENTNSPSSGRPSNLCQELLAFVRQPAATVKAAEPPAQLATAVSAKKSDDTSEKPSAPGTPQNTSGQSGQITSSGPGAAGPQGETQNRAAPVGSTATSSAPAKDASVAPSAAPPVPMPSPENVQQVEKDASNNNIQGCRATAQSMRRSGVAMPSPLLALAAMSVKLLEAAPRP
jgi:hypothetical protein